MPTELFWAFSHWIQSNFLEFIAVIAGIIGVYLTARLIIWCWPVAIINVLLSAYIFYHSKLYQDSLLQVFYLVMAVYGWYNWMHGGKNKTALKISRLRFKWIIIWLFTGSVCIFLFGYIFGNYTDASLPYWDASTTVWGIIGTFLMASKKIENWIVWIIIDILNAGIYYYKELYGFSILYLVFTILAVYGLINWYQELKLQKQE